MKSVLELFTLIDKNAMQQDRHALQRNIAQKVGAVGKRERTSNMPELYQKEFLT